MNHEVFQSGWQEQAFFPDQCKCQVLFLLVLSDCSLPSFGSLFSHSCADHSSVEDSGLGWGGGLQSSGFPSEKHSPLLLCATNSNGLGLPRVHQALGWFPLPEMKLINSLKRVSWANIGGSHPLLSVSQGSESFVAR